MMKKINDKSIFFICVSLISLSYLVTSFLFTYEDLISLTAWSVNFWDALFQGRIMDYYALAVENMRGAFHSVPEGSYFTFFPMIIWNFPLFIAHRISGNPLVNDIISLSWSRLLFVVALLVLCFFVYRIVIKMTGDKQKGLISILLISGCFEIYDSIAYAGQDEIVYLMFVVIGLYYRIKENRITSFIMFVIAVTLNPIMLIPFIVLELVYDKRVHFVLLKVFISVLPTLLHGFMYSNDPVFSANGNINTIRAFQLMMNTSTISSSFGSIPLGFVVLVIIIFLAYIVKIEDENKPQQVFYLFACVFFILSFMSYCTWYRLGLYAPFFVLFLLISNCNLNINIFMFSIIAIARMISSLSQSYNFNYRYYTGIIGGLEKISDTNAYSITGMGFDVLYYLSRPIAFGTALIFLWINRPKVNKDRYEMKFSWRAVLFVYSSTTFVFTIYIIAYALTKL